MFSQHRWKTHNNTTEIFTAGEGGAASGAICTGPHLARGLLHYQKDQNTLIEQSP